MGCCSGYASWYSCYPSPCGSDGCCCQPDCNHACNAAIYPTCGPGACCTCNDNNWGYAIANGTSAVCGMSENCGDYQYFTSDLLNWYGAPRVDTNGTPSRMSDFTKAFFSFWAPLSQGLVYLDMMDNNPC